MFFCAQRARLKVSPAFSKAVESRGKASGRAPQSAKLSFCSKKIRKGVQGGNPIKGFPPCFAPCACAPLCFSRFRPRIANSTPFLWSLPKETVSSRQRKAPFGAGLYHNFGILSVSHTVSSCPARRVGTFAPGEGHRVRRLPDYRPPHLRRGRTCSPGSALPAQRYCRRRVRSAIVKTSTKSRFSLGLTPFLLARAKEMGCLAAGRSVKRPAQRRTRASEK